MEDDKKPVVDVTPGMRDDDKTGDSISSGPGSSVSSVSTTALEEEVEKAVGYSAVVSNESNDSERATGESLKRKRVSITTENDNEEINNEKTMVDSSCKRTRRAAAAAATAAVSGISDTSPSATPKNGDSRAPIHILSDNHGDPKPPERIEQNIEASSGRSLGFGSNADVGGTAAAVSVNGACTRDHSDIHKKDAETSSSQNTVNGQTSMRGEIVSCYVNLPSLNSNVPGLPALSQREVIELETALGINGSGKRSVNAGNGEEEEEEEEEDNSWREDWSGNLALVDKDIHNPGNRHRLSSVSSSRRYSTKKSVLHWAQDGNPYCVKILHYLIRYVYHLEGTPQYAKVVFANANPSSLTEMEQAVRRVLYDPSVLQQDGWTTAPAKQPVGATGGPYRIGEKIRWQNFDAVVIAYIHDNDMGDLWRAFWIDDGVETFDLEAEELADARRMWEKSQKQQKVEKGATTTGEATTSSSSRRSSRFLAGSDFTVPGVKYGIVLAASYSKGARSGVYWPARIMHASETAETSGRGKRSAPRQRLDVVFLAPYWNTENQVKTSIKPRRVEAGAQNLSDHAAEMFNAGPLFDFENIDASEEMIKEYPYETDDGINIDQLKLAFRFTGLPKAVFLRFLDSHRLALSLKTYARRQLKPTLSRSSAAADLASAGLFDTHPMSVQVPIFPSEILHLPFHFILAQLPSPGRLDQQLDTPLDNAQSHIEPVLQLDAMVDAMRPPYSWGQGRSLLDRDVISVETPTRKSSQQIHESPSVCAGITLLKSSADGFHPLGLDHFTSDLKQLNELLLSDRQSSPSPLGSVVDNLKQLLSALSGEVVGSKLDKKESRNLARSLYNFWAITKSLGEEAICSTFFVKGKDEAMAIVTEWRRACERIYKYITHLFSHPGFGDGVSAVITDNKCNEHITSCGCFERPVRLPAALKAAKDIGAGSKKEIMLVTSVEDHYLDVAENKVLIKAHSASYIRRMKGRCSAIKGTQIVPLTEDSSGNGGEDTKGSRGTWMAAVASVGAALKAVDMVVRGECVNAFCITRPPGHHAGRELHAMKAVSNGFCILNTAACAALHATTPAAEGGIGLKRVCVIDFDVHHGNGTQDILCSTYDPRFLYVSLHAGGAHVNGIPPSEDMLDKELQSPRGYTSQLKGIFPGRCGDSSPHKGVLNIPLGPKVASHAVGTALISQVTPAVDAFAPDLIILSAGFDAHRNDPLGLGALSSDDFGHITDAVCQLAFKCCSGRLISVLEGGYGVPCCRPQDTEVFLPKSLKSATEEKKQNDGNGQVVPTQQTEDSSKTQNGNSQMPNTPLSSSVASIHQQRPQPSKLLELGDNLPSEMDDQVPYALQRRLEKCNMEGFMECVGAHVQSLAKCSKRS